jgi:organic radical activating enzyme
MNSSQVNAMVSVAELYGPVWQGEGPSQGRVCSFLRLMGCNLTCGYQRIPRVGTIPIEGAWQCDEPATWHSKHRTVPKWMTAQQIIDYHAKVSPPGAMLVITGGEPLLQQDRQAFRDLLFVLDQHRIEVETNGTIMPSPYTLQEVTQFNVSPKTVTSGITLADRWHPDVLTILNHSGKGVLKVVCTSPEDVWDAHRMAMELRWPLHRVWVMPEGVTPEGHLETARAIAPTVREAGLNLTLRQHTLIYGTEKEPRQ